MRPEDLLFPALVFFGALVSPAAAVWGMHCLLGTRNQVTQGKWIMGVGCLLSLLGAVAWRLRVGFLFIPEKPSGLSWILAVAVALGLSSLFAVGAVVGKLTHILIGHERRQPSGGVE